MCKLLKEFFVKNLFVILATFFLGSTVFASGPKFYGDLRFSVVDVDQKNATTAETGFVNNNSRIGVKGAHELDIGNNMKGIYHLQVMYVSGDDVATSTFTPRLGFVGIKSDWGTLTVGDQSRTYKMVALKMDPFYDSSAGEGNGGKTYGLSVYTNGWPSNMVKYKSPKMMGFSFNASTEFDDDQKNQHDNNFGLSYDHDFFQASVQYLDVNDIIVEDEEEALRFNLKVMYEKLTAGLSYESVTTHLVTQEPKKKYMYLLVSYQLDALKLAASYGSEEDFASGNEYKKDGTGMNFGGFYKLGKNTTASLLYSKVDYESVTGSKDRTTMALGLSQKF